MPVSTLNTYANIKEVDLADTDGQGKKPRLDTRWKLARQEKFLKLFMQRVHVGNTCTEIGITRSAFDRGVCAIRALGRNAVSPSGQEQLPEVRIRNRGLHAGRCRFRPLHGGIPIRVVLDLASKMPPVVRASVIYLIWYSLNKVCGRSSNTEDSRGGWRGSPERL